MGDSTEYRNLKEGGNVSVSIIKPETKEKEKLFSVLTPNPQELGVYSIEIKPGSVENLNKDSILYTPQRGG